MGYVIFKVEKSDGHIKTSAFFSCPPKSKAGISEEIGWEAGLRSWKIPELQDSCLPRWPMQKQAVPAQAEGPWLPAHLNLDGN